MHAAACDEEQGTSQRDVIDRQRIRTGGGVIIPDDERPERTGEAKREDRSDGTREAG